MVCFVFLILEYLIIKRKMFLYTNNLIYFLREKVMCKEDGISIMVSMKHQYLRWVIKVLISKWIHLKKKWYNVKMASAVHERSKSIKVVLVEGIKAGILSWYCEEGRK